MAAANLASPAPKRPARLPTKVIASTMAMIRNPISHNCQGNTIQPSTGHSAAIASTALFGIFIRAMSDQDTHSAMGRTKGRKTSASRSGG